jgi:alpha-galactosidase
LSDIGIEEVHIDNGWWGKNGEASWKADPQLWPSGMEIAGKMARENGFKFTLYFLLRGEGATVKRLHETMTAYGVDTYRSDMGAPNEDFLDALAAIHPNFRFEFCDDGGKRMDYSMLRRASTIFVVDRYDPLTLRMAMYAKSYVVHPAQFLIPLETAEAVGKSKETMRYVLRTTMPGQFVMGLSGRGGYVIPSDHPPIIEVAKESISLYKTRIRPLIREGNLYHVFLRPDGTDWDGVQLHDPAKGKGAVLLFKPNNKVDTRRIVLKGLDRTKTYALTFQDRPQQNVHTTGADLMDQGFDVTMTGQNVSEIVWVEEAR